MNDEILLTNKMYLTIGDWSGDGHSKYNKVLIKCNKTVDEIRQAYKDSVKLTGIAFDHRTPDARIRLFTKYEDCIISYENIKILKSHGCLTDEIINTFEDGVDEYGTLQIVPDDFPRLFFSFIMLSIPDLIWSKIYDDIPSINGFYNKDLNVQFGYGLY